MCILMLFNDTDSMSFSDIRETCNIPENELKRSLQSLACVKVRVRETEEFSFVMSS